VAIRLRKNTARAFNAALHQISASQYLRLRHSGRWAKLKSSSVITVSVLMSEMKWMMNRFVRRWASARFPQHNHKVVQKNRTCVILSEVWTDIVVFGGKYSKMSFYLTQGQKYIGLRHVPLTTKVSHTRITIKTMKLTNTKWSKVRNVVARKRKAVLCILFFCIWA